MGKRFTVATLLVAVTTIALDVSQASAADSCQTVFDAMPSSRTHCGAALPPVQTGNDHFVN